MPSRLRVRGVDHRFFVAKIHNDISNHGDNPLHLLVVPDENQVTFYTLKNGGNGFYDLSIQIRNKFESMRQDYPNFQRPIRTRIGQPAIPNSGHEFRGRICDTKGRIRSERVGCGWYSRDWVLLVLNNELGFMERFKKDKTKVFPFEIRRLQAAIEDIQGPDPR